MQFSGRAIDFKKPVRPLHWVVKTPDLIGMVSFMKMLQARVLRHEEFSEGCEGTCNGTNKGAWSKTMMGWDNENDSFVFEIVYNYNIDKYEYGNDFAWFGFYKYS